MSPYLDIAAIVISIWLAFIGTSWWSGKRISTDTEARP